MHLIQEGVFANVIFCCVRAVEMFNASETVEMQSEHGNELTKFKLQLRIFSNTSKLCEK